MTARLAQLLLAAAAIPVERRRALAYEYRSRRLAGAAAGFADSETAQFAGIPLDVLRIAIHGGVWDCAGCGRTSFRLRGPSYVYIQGDPAAACCVAAREGRQAA